MTDNTETIILMKKILEDARIEGVGTFLLAGDNTVRNTKGDYVDLVTVIRSHYVLKDAVSRCADLIRLL